MTWGNCWLYAFFKRLREGGWLMARKSLFGWWPHYAHMSKDGHITEFTPIAAKRKRLLPPLIFKGEIKELHMKSLVVAMICMVAATAWAGAPLQSQAVLSPSSWAFGNHSTNTSTDKVVTLSNPGNDILEQAQLSVTGTGYSLLSTTCGSNPFDLAILGSCTATVRFTPLSVGALPGSLNVAAPNLTPAATTLSGTGVFVVDYKIAKCYAYVDSTSTATALKIGVYKPDLTLATSSASASGLPGSPSWVMTPMSGSFEVIPGSTYRISVLTNGYWYPRTKAATWVGRYNGVGAYPTLPGSINTSSDSNDSLGEIGVYCTNASNVVLIGNNNTASFTTVGGAVSARNSYLISGYVAPAQ